MSTEEFQLDADAIASCPFCCKAFSSESRLLTHVKAQECCMRLKRKKDDPMAMIASLVARLEQVEKVVDGLNQRINVLSQNEVILLERLRLKDEQIRKQSTSQEDTYGTSGTERIMEKTTDGTFPPHGQCVPYDRCSIAHIKTSDLAKCVKEFEISGIRRMTRMIYFSPDAPRNKSIIVTKGRSSAVYIYTDDGQWDAHSKNSALKRISRQVLNYMSAKLDDEDLQAELMELGVARAKLEQVIQDIDECINDTSGKSHRRFYDDLWSTLIT